MAKEIRGGEIEGSLATLTPEIRQFFRYNLIVTNDVYNLRRMKMRQYQIEDNKLIKVLCNCCGKELKVENG